MSGNRRNKKRTRSTVAHEISEMYVSRAPTAAAVPSRDLVRCPRQQPGLRTETPGEQQRPASPTAQEVPHAALLALSLQINKSPKKHQCKAGKPNTSLELSCAKGQEVLKDQGDRLRDREASWGGYHWT